MKIKVCCEEMRLYGPDLIGVGKEEERGKPCIFQHENYDCEDYVSEIPIKYCPFCGKIVVVTP